MREHNTKNESVAGGHAGARFEAIFSRLMIPTADDTAEHTHKSSSRSS